MRVRRDVRWCVLVCSMVWSGGMPAVWAHSEEAAISVRTYTPMTIDGKLDDWIRRLQRSDWDGQLQVKNGEVLDRIRAVPVYLNSLTSVVEAGRVSHPDDLSGVLYTTWDEAHVYVAAIISDDQIVTQHEGADIWQDDCVELWFDCRHDAVTRTLFQDDEYQVGFSPNSQYRNQPVVWAWRNPKAEAVVKAAQVASTMISGGYIIEAAIPWSSLQGCQPATGKMMGFNVSIVDKDEDQLWTHLTWSGQLHSDPSQFGHLYFVDAPVDLFSEDVLEAPAPLLIEDPVEQPSQE